MATGSLWRKEPVSQVMTSQSKRGGDVPEALAETAGPYILASPGCQAKAAQNPPSAWPTTRRQHNHEEFADWNV